ncbi:MAG TPA: IS21 family transposase [Thermomicrobiales bacterium]|nr:IS21 family transposase [Thermomicrobiales bacterium]
MERSAIKVLAKRGLSHRRIAAELGHSPTTVARVLKEPVDARPAKRRRRSQVDPYRAQIEQWLRQGLSIVRMLELARADPARPYTGGRAVFSDHVRRIRLELARAEADVPVRFEGLPAEYLQVDWGEVARCPFGARPPGKRYFLACRLKYSRWAWVRFTRDMRQETLLRGLVDCFAALGWVPWVLVFDNMKTVTSGRDAAGQPIWTPALLQLAAEFGFHPEACAVGAANQKGAVENLVKWVKGNFLAGRAFADDADLAAQAAEWQAQANARPSAATGRPPAELLPREAAQGGALPATARDYGVLEHAQVSVEALVTVRTNRYSVPVAHVGAPVTVRLHRERVRLWRDTALVADHPRAPDGARRRVVDPAHFAPLFPAKPRAQAMLYRQALLELGEPAAAFMTELSRRQRARLGPEVLAVYALLEEHGVAALLAAMARAAGAGRYSAEALGALLGRARARPAIPPLALPGVPSQAEIDRPLSAYEALVQVDVAREEAVAPGAGR